MKIQFNISYNTAWGEELYLNFCGNDNGGLPSDMALSTADGRTWTCACSADGMAGLRLYYYYTVKRGGSAVRSEWLVVKHCLTLPHDNEAVVTVNDKWNDIPTDSYLYTSAFTDCLNRRQPLNNDTRFYAKTVVLKVRAPQLPAGHRLALTGGLKCLGRWKTAKALKMHEQQPCEWCVNINAAELKGTFDYKFIAVDTDTEDVVWEDGFNHTMTLYSEEDTTLTVLELGTARFALPQTLVAGVVVPVFSLRSEGGFGVGDFGDLVLMTDWAAANGLKAVQLLPVNDTTITHTWTDSYPYNSISIYALHPQYIDLRQLPELKDKDKAGRFEQLRQELNALSQIDYERVNSAKIEYLREVYRQEHATVMRRASFKKFFNDNRGWLVPYAAYCHYRDLYGTASFSQWPEHRRFTAAEAERMGDPKSAEYREVAFWYYVQYVLDTQLKSAHEHARRNGVILKGDVPIGISRDGVEAWVEPRYFNLNGQAGAPPDAFSVNGQNWGFPTYNWDVMLSDGCEWWKRRFKKMAEYFDAYRIDHVLGFFRIWEIPINAVHGLLGQFSPALPLSREEIASYGFNFQEERYTTPFITDWVLDRIFKENAAKVKEQYLEKTAEGYRMKPEYDTQRKVEAAFSGKTDETDLWLRDGLYALISDVLFVRDRKNPDMFHPRISAQLDFAYESLYECDKQAFNRLYNDYFYHRNNQFWYSEAMKKLPLLTQATRMLVCAEDLGMVPDCVPWVMDELRILTLEIQSMPKDDSVKFGVLDKNPYRSVCTISTHDMPTLRQWWDEDPQRTQEYYNTTLWHSGEAPHPLPGKLAKDIVSRNLACPSMLCLLSLQDWLATDERLRLPDANGERINIPANVRHYWRYRMHLTIEQLISDAEFNASVRDMVEASGRL